VLSCGDAHTAHEGVKASIGGGIIAHSLHSSTLGLQTLEDAVPERFLRDVLEDYAPFPEPYVIHGMDLIAGHLTLTRTERRLPGFTNAGGRLKVTLDRLRIEGTQSRNC
jgi:hypothetical protein